MSATATTGLNPEVLFQASKILLTGTFGISLALSFRDSEELEPAFINFAGGFLSLLFFRDALTWLMVAGHELSEFIAKQGDPRSLREMVLTALSQAGQAPLPNGAKTVFNAPSFLEQAFRLGIWGVVSQIADFFFLLASFLIETTHRVLWEILLFLFPLGCGVFPMFRGILKNFALYAVELTLWEPILGMIQITTGVVAKCYAMKPGSLGLPIVAVEIVAIVLMVSVPAITHRIINGALQSDLGGASTAALAWANKIKGGFRAWAKG